MNYLDITFDFTDSSHCLFGKAKKDIKCIQKELNHPSSIIKQFSLSVENRFSKLSSNEKIFSDSITRSTNKSRLQSSVKLTKA